MIVLKSVRFSPAALGRGADEAAATTGAAASGGGIGSNEEPGSRHSSAPRVYSTSHIRGGGAEATVSRGAHHGERAAGAGESSDRTVRVRTDLLPRPAGHGSATGADP